MAITAAFVKVSLDSKHSRRRLRELESNDSFSDRLRNVLKRLDKDVEDAIADMIDQSGLEPVSEAAAAGPTVTSAPHISPAESPGETPVFASASEARIKGASRRLLKRKMCDRDPLRFVPPVHPLYRHQR